MLGSQAGTPALHGSLVVKPVLQVSSRQKSRFAKVLSCNIHIVSYNYIIFSKVILLRLLLALSIRVKIVLTKNAHKSVLVGSRSSY